MPLLQFGSQGSEEVRLEHQSKGIAWTVIKTVNNKEGTNSRCQGQEEFVPNRQEDAGHDEEGIKVDRSQSKLIFELKYRRVNEGYLYERENCYDFSPFLKHLSPCLLLLYICSSRDVSLQLHFLSPYYSSSSFLSCYPLISPTLFLFTTGRECSTSSFVLLMDIISTTRLSCA